MFDQIKQLTIDRIKDSTLEVTENTKLSKVAGVYMIYIDSLSDDKVLPIYIGQSDNIQKRYSAHLKEILALNRLTKETYERYHSKLFYNGRFKACKIFKYMVDHKCHLSDFRMIILEECKKTELDLIERRYIKEFHSEYYGFNQLETISGQMKEDYKSKSKDEKQQLIYKELTNVDKYFDYGFNKFNFSFAYGMIDTSDDDKDKGLVQELKTKIRNRLSNNPTKEYIVEDFDEYFTKRHENKVKAVKRYLIPTVEYNDFPLKSREISVPFPKLKKNECGVYFAISNTNRWFGDTCHCAEVIKVISKYVKNGEKIIKEYFIDNESINHYYYEKDINHLIFRKNPFQLSTGNDFLYMISLSTEFKTGINDYDFKEKPLLHLNEAISDIIDNAPDNCTFKLYSNQSKKVMDACLLRLDFLFEEKLQNRKSKDFNFEGTSFLLINNDLFKGSRHTKLLKSHGIKIRRVNDFERGLNVAKKGEYSYVLFKVNRSNDKTLKIIRNLYEQNIDARIIVINNGGVKTREKLNELKNIEEHSFITVKDFLKKLLI